MTETLWLSTIRVIYSPTNSEDLLAFESHMTASSITNAWVGVKQETKEPSWWRWMTACQGCLEDTIRTGKRDSGFYDREIS